MAASFPQEVEEHEQPATELTAALVDKKLSEESGVEYEDEDPQPFAESGVQPFDPTLIRIETRTITIDGMIKRIANEEINLRPDFQRMGGIWNDGAQSRLIESLLIRIPLPAFYMDATEVTNEAYAKFAEATGYVTVAERIPRAENFPGAPPENLVAGSTVFTPTAAPVPLDSH